MDIKFTDKGIERLMWALKHPVLRAIRDNIEYAWTVIKMRMKGE